MKSFLLKIFTWWNSSTFGTDLWTWLHGEKVGTDEFGNTYYRTRGGKVDKRLLFERRWVIYSGYAEASTIPPSWQEILLREDVGRHLRPEFRHLDIVQLEDNGAIRILDL